MTDGGSDTFTRDRLLWQEQVLADRGMTLLALHVALVIGQHVNRKTGEAWPSQVRMAEVLQVTARAIRGAVEQLVNREHLSVVVRHGRGDSNRYRPILRNRNGGSAIDLEKGNDGSGLEAENRNGSSAIRDENRNGGSPETGTAVPTNSLNEPSEGESLFPPSNASPKQRRPSAPKPKTSDAQFDEFWLCVPRAKDKADARRAYDKAILSGAVTHHEIMIGIARYAAERQGQDPNYTKYPATWLNKGGWADAPIRSNEAQQQQRGRGRRLNPDEYIKQRYEEIGDE